MHSSQIKRQRPTLKTAHDFYREGSFSIDPKRHFLSGEEREREIEKVSEELQEIIKSQFPRTQNLEYAILKSHLIIERALTQYIRCFARTAVSAEEIRFTFSQKLEIAYLLGFGANDPIVLPTIQALNKVRNQVAHTFTLDRVAVDELLRINHDNYENFKPRNDRERVRALRWVCVLTCARVAGTISAAYYTVAEDDAKRKANR
jgi:hypothetical protein